LEFTNSHAAEIQLLDAKPLQTQGDLSAQMVTGIGAFFDRKTTESLNNRKQFWHYDFSSRENYEKSVATNRNDLRRIIGAADAGLPITALEYVSDTQSPARITENSQFTVYAVRWVVFPNVYAEGLWIKQKASAKACVVALPDADQTPEMLVGLAPGIKPESQFARRLAERGCEVLVPVLVSREDTFSGNPKINRFTNQPHREWIYRQAFQMGRHIIGYEVQKVLAAVDFFTNDPRHGKIGVAGYGEGGLLALYAGALDPRVEATLVSGYFGPRQELWREPIYRNVFGLLKEFGDAEIAALVLPRSLIVEYSDSPHVDGPPASRAGRAGAAPGRIVTPDYATTAAEIERTRGLVSQGGPDFEKLKFIAGPANRVVSTGSDGALVAFLNGLGVKPATSVAEAGNLPDAREHFDPGPRQQRQVEQLSDFTQQLFRDSARLREEFFWKRLKSATPDSLPALSKPLKDYLWDEVIGRINEPALPPSPRSRKIIENEKWTAHEVVLDVFPEVFAWGYLLLPADLKPGERRPVVVCQHGLEGVPADVITGPEHPEAYNYYKSFAARLAERGYVVFAPHNPYRGGDQFRLLQRKANPLGKSLFSVILAQHQQILNWLGQQPFVDQTRIGFYGLSYGGKTAMRVPALLDGYALSICSADFNDWNQKLVSLDYPGSYMFTHEWEMDEFDLGNRFDHAEMAALIAPRPFMVERGHYDNVGIDPWVAAEYSLVRRFYMQLGIPDKTQIEFFNGPHTINGVGTFAFLREHLKWPEQK
jgi:dienelactone hydrolase